MLDLAYKAHPALNGLIFHTDQGWQYQHSTFQKWLTDHGIEQSMSRKGNSLDDGLMEGFLGILKREMWYGFEKIIRIQMNQKMQSKSIFITIIILELRAQ